MEATSETYDAYEPHESEQYNFRLRRGYTIKVGDDMMRGPKLIRLPRELAKKYLHMAENQAEIRKRLGMPSNRPKPSILDEIKKRSADRARSRAEGKADGITRDDVVAIVDAAIGAKLPALADDIVARVTASLASQSEPKAKRSARR